jgi:ADP-heptose:LPS heptosyltransferase
MHPDTMRKVDRLAGAPLCWVMTLLFKLCKLFCKGPESQRPKRIMFIELAEIGGLVVAYPCLAHAQKKFPDAELYFCTFKGGKGILGLMGLIPEERQIIIDPDGLVSFIATTIKALIKMRKAGIDAVINLETYARFSTLLTLMSGADKRVGFDRFYEEGHYIGDLYTHKVIYNPHVHAAKTFITLVEALGEAPDNQPRAKLSLDEASLEVPCIQTAPRAKEVITGKIREQYPTFSDTHKLVILNPNASDLVAARRWPTEYFLELAKGLLEDPSLLIVLTGTPAEKDYAEKVRAAMASDRVVNLAGKTTLPELIDLYNQCSLLVTNDSGPAHFASLTRLPVLVLFGPETPDIYGPLGPKVQVITRRLACSPCVSVYNQKRSVCTDNVCLTSITPAEILERSRAILNPGAS